MENLPTGRPLNIFATLEKEGSVIYQSEVITFTLTDGTNFLNIALKTPESKADSTPKGFVFVKGGAVTGRTNTNNYNGVFINGRTVTLSDFYMGECEVTQAEYENVMKNQTFTVDGTTYQLNAEPSYFTSSATSDYGVNFGTDNSNRPVEGVNWYEAVYYCNARSLQENLTPTYTIEDMQVEEDSSTKKVHIKSASVSLVENADGYRLPTEAEWEYAARGGDPTEAAWSYVFSGCNTKNQVYNESEITHVSSDSCLDGYAWYCYNNKDGSTGETDYSLQNSADGKGTHVVGRLKPNLLGLYDMSGNVSEWVYDWYSETIETTSVTNPTGPTEGDNRIARGGSWMEDAYFCSVCHRNTNNDTFENPNVGFRVVRSVK